MGIISKDILLQLKPGDRVRHSSSNKWEQVFRVLHKFHPTNKNKEDYCMINSMEWLYNDIVDINKGR